MADHQGSGYLIDYAAKWTFSAVPGIFREFTPEDMPDGKLPTQPRLALLHQDYPPSSSSIVAPSTSEGYTQDWPRFAQHVRSLNKQAPDGVRYKVLYLTRHGVGYHNKKSTEVGVEAWDVSRFLSHSLSIPTLSHTHTHSQNPLTDPLGPSQRRRRQLLVRFLPRPGRRSPGQRPLGLLLKTLHPLRRPSTADRLHQPALPLPADYGHRLPPHPAAALPRRHQGEPSRALDRPHLRPPPDEESYPRALAGPGL